MNLPRLFQLFLLFGLIIFLYKLLWEKKDTAKSGSRHDASESTEPMIKDPVCGTFIPKSQTLMIKHKNEVVYFCSDKCKKEFIKQNK